MCGIVGFIGGPDSEENLTRQVQAMSDAIVSRGPDSSGEWVDGGAGLAFGHRRLSILDLSPLGHQPMISSSGRYVIILNGEIYNFQELRGALESSGSTFRGKSDTEVLLEAVEQWGIRRTLEKSVGMFAIAIWDRKERRLTLARDRFGEKPIYYGKSDGIFYFGSELKSFAQHPRWTPEVDLESIALFLRHSYIPHPRSIYRGIHKLTPGCFIEIDPTNLDADAKPQEYWSPSDMVERASRNLFTGSIEDAVSQLEEHLIAAIRGQMISDVPLGAFLSGGVDSSAIVALMQKISSKPVKTFTIGFAEKDFDEAGFARKIAHHLGTDHHELYAKPQEAMEIIPQLASYFDEPFADSSQIPTILVAKLARSHVTVSLSGDAGDELFGGYTRYRYAETIYRWMRRTPRSALLLGSKLIQGVSEDTWDAMFSILPRGNRLPHMGTKAHKLASILAEESETGVYGKLISHVYSSEPMVVGLQKRVERVESRAIPTSLKSFTEKMMFLDMTNYLPDDILTKVDRASMAVSLESRVPLLDHRLAEFCWTLPLDLKMREGKSKWPLRQVLYKHVPKNLIERPKMGFGVPVNDWIRGPLRDWAESLMSREALQRSGLIEVEPARRLWDRFLKRQGAMGFLVWDILMLQSWSQRWLESPQEHQSDRGLKIHHRASR